jgi:predicted murein hydrolase (TIGR00659 family)
MEFSPIAALFAGLTVVVYVIANFFYLRFRKTPLNPVLTATVALVLMLVVFDVPYETYMTGGDWIATLLGPAVVALAVPLYKHRKLLQDNLMPIAIGIVAGVIVGLVSGTLFTRWLGFSEELIYTVLPKSLTTPVAMQIASTIGGIPSLAAVFVMVAGFTGILLGPYLLQLLGIDSPIGRGIGLGASAHGLGTAKAFEYGPEDASMSSVAMTLSAVLGALLSPLAAWLLM